LYFAKTGGNDIFKKYHYYPTKVGIIKFYYL